MPDDRESYSTTIRNMGLLFGGALALWLAFSRGRVADRQARIAQQNLLNDRFQKGMEKLGSGDISVRLGGIYELQRLAEEQPEQYHVSIMRRFCAFLRNPISDGSGREEVHEVGEPPHEAPRIREDVQAVLEAIGSRCEEQIDIEGKARFQFKMRDSDMRNAELSGANLTSAPWSDLRGISKMEVIEFGNNVDFSGVKLCSAKLDLADMPNVNFEGACLCGAWLGHTNLTGANLAGANLHEALTFGPILTGARFSYEGMLPAKGIRQSDLDSCYADPMNPPDLSRVRDVETNKLLRWSGKPIDSAA